MFFVNKKSIMQFSYKLYSFLLIHNALLHNKELFKGPLLELKYWTHTIKEKEKKKTRLSLQKGTLPMLMLPWAPGTLTMTSGAKTCSGNCIFPLPCWVIASQLCPPGTHASSYHDEISKWYLDPKRNVLHILELRGMGAIAKRTNSVFSRASEASIKKGKEMHPEYQLSLHFYFSLSTPVPTAKRGTSRCVGLSVSTPMTRTREHKESLAGSGKWLISSWEDRIILPDIKREGCLWNTSDLLSVLQLVCME